MPGASLSCLETEKVAYMHKFYVPRSATMKAVDDCRSVITRHHGSEVGAGVDLIGIYLELPDASTLLMAKECCFSAPKKAATES
jgi:hypothetical protein